MYSQQLILINLHLLSRNLNNDHIKNILIYTDI